jgi:hypothetical protein
MNIQFQKEGLHWVAEFQVTADFNLHLEREGTGSLRIMQSTVSGGMYDRVKGGSFNYNDLVVDIDFTSVIYPKFIQVISMSEPTLAEVTCPEGEVTVVEKTISFSIAGTQYTAKPGMTWTEWCDSEFNVDGYVIVYISSLGGGGNASGYYYGESVVSQNPDPLNPSAVFKQDELKAEEEFDVIVEGHDYKYFNNNEL